MKKLLSLLLGILLLAGCASEPNESYDYTALKQSKPKSILVVMPINNSPDAKADMSVLARATYSLSELGYYVYPVALVDEVFKQNGLTDGNAIRSAKHQKIQEIFGADSILYIDVNEYGTSYKIFDSVTAVALDATLIDLRTGKTLWTGTGKVVQGSTSSGDSALFALVKATVSQVVSTTKDRGYDVAASAMNQLIYRGKNGGLLIGPRHPNYGKESIKK